MNHAKGSYLLATALLATAAQAIIDTDPCTEVDAQRARRSLRSARDRSHHVRYL